MKDFNSIFIGAMTKQYARDSDIGTSQNPWKKLVIFSLNVQSIYKQTSIPVLKNVIKSLPFLWLPERHQAMLEELHVLMQKFSFVPNCWGGGQIANFGMT